MQVEKVTVSVPRATLFEPESVVGLVGQALYFWVVQRQDLRVPPHTVVGPSSAQLGLFQDLSLLGMT